jgi:hypothetical protein
VTSSDKSSKHPAEPELTETETQTSPRVRRLPALRSRPATGLLAWQSTVGYISQNRTPNAQFSIAVIPHDRVLSWSAALSWGRHREQVIQRATLAAALHDLWSVVSQNVVIFEQKADEALSPAHYDQAEWLDIPTQEVLQRLLWMTMTVFKTRWHLLMIYQPVETTQRRFEMRLLAQSPQAASENDTGHYDIVVGALGPSLMDACRTLYRNAAPHFLVYTTQTHDQVDTGEDANDHQP